MGTATKRRLHAIMMTPASFSRRSWPLWPWLLLTLLLGALAIYAPPPKELPEPPQVAELFHQPVLVADDGSSYRFIEFGKHTSIVPLYAVSRMVTAQQSVARTLGWNAGGVSLGFYHRNAAWRFGLSTNRFDSQWKSSADGAASLPEEEIAKLRPLIIVELNQRGESRGERLQQLLEHGLSAESVLCWQNAVVLLAWLALAMSLMTLMGKALHRLAKSR
jgi:hypothetical protein